MAVFTKLNQADIIDVQNIFGLSKIKNFKGIKKGIENTNYIINTKSKKSVSYTHLTLPTILLV